MFFASGLVCLTNKRTAVFGDQPLPAAKIEHGFFFNVSCISFSAFSHLLGLIHWLKALGMGGGLCVIGICLG